MPAQGGVTATDQQKVFTRQALGLKGRIQSRGDRAVAVRRCLRCQGPGVGQKKQQRRRMPQPLSQRLHIPAQQQRTAVHRLRAGGVVVNHHNLHGTIVP